MTDAGRGAPELATRDFPRPPSLVPGIEFIGKLQGSGFAEDQWLVRHDGRFVQLTELLYRVAEAIDGERSVEEIAVATTAATPWLVSGDQVALLIEQKLAPLGLVAGMTSAAAEPPAGSMVGLYARRRVIPARLVDALARPARHLFWPPALAVLVGAIVLIHVWLYSGDQIANGVLQLIYAPLLLVVLLGVLLLAGLFHELGHAAGLIYGGGRVGGMGFGLVLVYPAFFTDVTDSYRLSRAARLRTDLGGIYFHLIATLAIAAVYLGTGEPFLLLAIVLIDVEIVRQLIPFLRLDGYWILADLAGVPDPFSQAAPFLRSLLRSRGPAGSRLPELRRGPRVAFAAFIILTIPALVVLAFLIVSGFPGLVRAGWDAAVSQLGHLAEARDHANPGATALALLQLALAALPIVLTVYLIVVVVSRSLRALFRWGRGNARRRAVSMLAALGGTLFLGALWIPQMPFVGVPPVGVEAFEVSSRGHVAGPVSYPQSPPVGGDHAQIWQNCGFYDVPVADENAVHSLEHGAIWITYRPDLPSHELSRLRSIAYSQIQILVTPYPGLQAPVVASAWGWQLALDSAHDPRLAQFIRAYRLAPSAPEPGRPCTNGLGTPG